MISISKNKLKNVQKLLNEKLPLTETEKLANKLRKELKEKHQKALTEAIVKGLEPLFKDLNQKQLADALSNLQIESKVEITIPEIQKEVATAIAETLTPLFEKLDQSQLLEAISNLKIELPKLEVPDIKIPEIDFKGLIPAISQAVAKTVGQEVAKIKFPKSDITVEASPIQIPDEMKVEGFKDLMKALFVILKRRFSVDIGFDEQNPLPVEIKTGGELLKAIRNLRLGDGGGGPAVVQLKNSNDEPLDPVGAADTQYIYHVQIAAVDTEYSQALPAGTKKFKIWAVDNDKTALHDDVLKVTLTENESGSVFNPILPGNYHEEAGLNLSDKTIYFQSPSANGYAIIIAWV